MIGHFLLTLCTEAEDAVLTSLMRRGYYFAPDSDARCLVGCAAGFGEHGRMIARPQHLFMRRDRPSTEARYDDLCLRFGTVRTNTAIRSRILTNRLWREMSRKVELTSVGANV